MSARKIGLTAAAALATLGIFVGGASLANAESGTTSSTSSTSSTAAAGAAPSGVAGQASQDTAVTGDELAKVTAAMAAQDSSVTVTEVRKDPDGSYDVLGTKDGSPVFYDVSSDLTTFTANTMQAPTGTSGQAPTGQPPTGTATPSSTTTAA
jgi:hypothetical protein